MHRPERSRLPPWIESLILSYGSREESVGTGRLRAHVIGAGHMSQSQALGAEGPAGILFLSDGLLQIPAILTASAWERLQEQEDRECFTSLVNATVCVQDSRLQFHMAPEQTRSRFFLSVGQLATTSAGPVKESTPCSTTLPAVRMKICQTWKALLGQETQDSSQYGCDLSELLGAWHHDLLQAALDGVRERLAAPASPRPSASTSAARDPPATRRHAFVATSWDVDRVRYKGEKSFSVPVKLLLIPEEDARRTPPDGDGGGGTANGLPHDDGARDSRRLPETAAPTVDDAEWRIPTPPVLESDSDADEASPEDGAPTESEGAVVIDWDIRSLSSLWDLHLPPCETSSCSEASASAPSSPARRRGAPELGSDPPATLSGGTPFPAHGSEDTEPSNLPPYQKPPAASLTSVSPTGAFFARPPDMLLASDDCGADAAGRTLPSMEKDAEDGVEGKSRKVQRKRSEPTPEADEEGVSRSPPSWLFDSQGASGADEVVGSGEGGVARKRPPTAHGDGRRFSYSYRLSGQNLQDFSRFRVTESLLQWAVKRLLAAAPVSSDARGDVP